MGLSLVFNETFMLCEAIHFEWKQCLLYLMHSSLAMVFINLDSKQTVLSFWLTKILVTLQTFLVIKLKLNLSAYENNHN